MKIPIDKLCAAAGITPRGYILAKKRDTPAEASTIAKLTVALNRFRLSFGQEAGALGPHAAFKMCLVHAAGLVGADARKVLASDPARKATMDPDWMKAAEARQLAFWIATQMLGFRGADVGRAAGVTKAAVSAAVREVEDARDADRDLDRILRGIEEVLS
ncbi:hypothetical protein [Mesorhizobium sp.]|uniref:hypothetical protein n=1 Tax=Mesorhizobium sp. TaxID=1871066 RepID=UPI000FE7E639|nr:hypothetical protein [Mesorhizobium sp.]RWI96076.1 MAG: hypothetical protein EOR21_08585 [Mesorhizobium sp.]